ncbi:MAG: NF038104 family lipoprotein [Pseudomonadota bacterium]
MRRIYVLAFLVMMLIPVSGCVGMVVGQTADAAIEVAKVPFKVGGAVIDVATGDDDDDEKDKDN